MRRIVSTHLFRRQRLQTAHLDTLRRAGVDGIELFCARPSFDYRNRSQVGEIAGWLADHPVGLHALHSPIYADDHEGRTGEPALNLADAEPRRRLEAMDETRRALDIAETTPLRYLVQHLGPRGLEWDARTADRALTSVERLRVLCKQLGVELLLENIPNGLAQPEALLNFLVANHLEDVGVCFDSGHANLAAAIFGGGGAVPGWDLLRERVRSTHLHDNDGTADDHRWPGDGTIPWPELAPRLLQAGAELPWVLEVGDHADTRDAGESVRRAFERLEGWARG